MPRSILKYYLSHRPLFLALIRAQELPFYVKNAVLKGKVLDFGCGDGFFLHCLHKFYPGLFKQAQIIGLDVNRQSLREAQKYPVYQQLVGLKDFEATFSQNCFEAVICNCVMEHLPDLPETVKKLWRVLKPGGKIFLTVMADQWEKYLILPKKFWRQRQKHYFLLSYQQWQELFRQAGFKIVKTAGYLGKAQSRLLEQLHFISLPYLIAYKLTGDWSKAGWWYCRLAPVNTLAAVFKKKPKLTEAAAVFFVLQK